MNIPSHAEVIVIGGGIIGCSTAYHLAKEHGAEVLLIERGKLTCGTTFHAAGLVGQLRTSASITQLLKYSVELYDTLEKETQLASGWKQNGGLRLANNQERWTEIKRQVTTARSFGLEMHLLSPREAKQVWPLMDENDLVGAALIPTDGQANPSDITQSLAKGARMHGARIIENVSVIQVAVKDGRVAGVQTTAGYVACEKVVNCAGQWSKQLAKKNGICVPVQSMQHQYLVTEPLDGVAADLPTLRDPDRLIYFKEEVGGLVMGGYEPNPQPWDVAPIPDDFSFLLLEENWPHFEQLMEQALIRVPSLEQAGIKNLTNGPESFTPDGNFILGEAPEVSHYFVGTGFNAFGIAAAGGAGKALASWVMFGEQPMDLWSVDIRRFSSLHRDDPWVKNRTIEACAKHYSMAWPNEEYQSGRPVLISPLYDRMKRHRACFGSKSGWERPNWFAPPDTLAQDVYSFGRQNWFSIVGREHLACRSSAVLFDQSSFAKYEICGEGAARGLSWLCANRVDRAPGTLVYTQMLNSKGGIECDLTVGRLADDLYYLVTGTGFRTHDFAWIQHNWPHDSQVSFSDVTEQWATLSLMGPHSRQILERVCDDDLSPGGFPFASIREIQIAGNAVRALRVTYVGELGWELHIPIANSGIVYDALWEAGQSYGLVNAGYRAIESLRLEKGYRAWGADITPADNPLEAGLEWAVKLKTDQSFLGRVALERLVGQPLSKKLCFFTHGDVDTVLNGRETILRNGVPVGYLSSAGWGYSIEKNIGYGYVRHKEGIDHSFLTSGEYALEVACEQVPCDMHLHPLYDPKGDRVKC